MGFRLFACGLLMASVELFPTPALSGSTPVPPLTTNELKCQRATSTAAADYVRRVFTARQACFETYTRSNTPPTVNCRASLDQGTGSDETDDGISKAEALLAVAIQTECLDVELENLGFPGYCEDTFGPPYDTFDHEQCIIDAANDVVYRLLDVEHPPWPGPNLPAEDATCQDYVASKSSSMFFKEVDRRAVGCEQRRLELKIAQEVNCRAEVDPLAPGTGDTGVDGNIVAAHDDVLRGIAEYCGRADLGRLGFPHECPNPDGSLFSVAALTECMYITHHDPLIDFIDTIIPSTTMCGNCVIDGGNGEACDDGDNVWAAGQICRRNCSQVTKCGDPNDTGTITVADALFMLRTGVGLETCHKSLCDLNNDNAIGSADALLALRDIVDLPVTLECPAAPAADLVCPAP